MTINLKDFEEITEVCFDGEDSHLALCHKDQGGSANGWHTSLLTKADMTISSNLIKALEQVSVKLSMEEFLRKFFGLWYDDAELLTKILGFETEFEYNQRVAEESDSVPATFQEFLEQRVGSFEIMKASLEGTKELSGEDYLEVLKTQIKFEKALDSERFAEVNLAEANKQEKVDKTSQAKLTKDKKPKEDLVDINDIIKSEEYQDMLKDQISKAVAKAEKAKDAELESVKSDLEKASEQLNVFAKEREDRQKKAFANLTKSFTFLDKDEDKDVLAEALFKAASVEGMDTIVSALESAQKEIVAVKEQFSKSDDEGVEDKQEQISVSKAEAKVVSLAERLAEQYKDKEYMDFK